VAFADVVLYPVRYYPLSGRLVAYEEMSVKVMTRAKATVARSKATEPGTWRARLRSETDAMAVAALLDNPDVLAAYSVEPLGDARAPADPDAGLVKPLGGSDTPVRLDDGEAGLPCLQSDAFKHVIITSEAIRDTLLLWNFDTIADLRRAQGLTSTIVTVEAIKAAYAGRDAAEQVRAFIQDAYDKWGTEYVLLGGDSQIVPMRRLFATAGGEQDHIPSDLYFQCLDGSFDSDGDGVWGEPTDGADRLDGRPGSDIDLYAEVAVGRVPVDDDLQLMQWVSKQVQYEADRLDASAPYLRGALFIGEYLGFGGVSDYATASMEEIRLGADTHGYRTAGFAALGIHTDVATLYDAPGDAWDNTELANLVNTDRFSLMNHLGHCNTDYCMKFTIAEVGALWANQKPGFLYSQGCYPGAFDEECIAETLVCGTESGLFGGVFNSRFGWGSYNTTDGPSQRYNRWFWNAFFGDLVPQVGQLNQQAHERNAPRIDESCMRWIYYESNLFGDPAQWLAGIAAEFRLDREAYRSDAAASVEVVWPMVDMAQQAVTVQLMVTNETGVVGQTNLVCLRYGALTAIGHFASDPVPLPSLGATNGCTVVARWEQPPTMRAFEDTAAVDDIPPVISNLHVTAADETTLTVAWNTDEMARGGARIGQQLPPADWDEVECPAFAASQQARFPGLAPFTRYYVAVWAEDLAGNTTNLPADRLSVETSDYLTAATVGRETVARYDFERGAEGWSVSNINNNACWQYGTPETYGPLDATRCWGTILDGRYPSGANATLVSPPFAVRGAPLITFRHWLDVQYSMNFVNEVLPEPVPYGDYGQIEVFAQGVWHNVTSYADISGGATLLNRGSLGWQRVRLELPPWFGHQVLAVRFRFVSDEQVFRSGNPAGWYVDDL
ncbi:MAG: hypothetical protein GX548_01475, partial [Lentisphaerae bacterium]|nr:hypothetical protein [Lentisphaerota bacterium]